MSEHGVHDFLTAKRKAAERFGITDEAVLPRNTEIEDALMEYQRLFAADTHGVTLKAQREVALQVMQWFSEFEPRLVGPVLSGTATAHTDVQLHLFAERAETVALRLLDRGVEHEVTERRLRLDAARFRAYPGLRFELSRQMVELTVFPTDGIRQAPVSPVDGRPMRRADTAELEQLVGASA
ncbi:MAG: hypothetical protein ABSE43_11225 [Steroidobacteraceae bacterium]